MLIHVTDPNDSSIKGVLDTHGGFSQQNLLAGGRDNFFIAEALCSDDPKIVFNLEEPPSFFDVPMLWGHLDENASLRLFLSPTTDDPTFPFARLNDFRAALDGTGAINGTGDLIRSNKLPPVVDWGISP